MKSLFLLWCLCISSVSFASWRNYTHPSEPIYEGSFAPGQSQGRETFRVVTFNINFSISLEGILQLWESHPVLKEADAVLLQEVVGEPGVPHANSAEVLARRLQLNYVYVPAFVHRKNGKDFGVAILSPHPISEAEKIVLPHPHFLEGTQRVAVGATIHTPQGNFRTYSTHIETLQFTHWRQRQVDPILQAARRHDGIPLIVGGDFNSAPVWQRWFLWHYARKQGWFVATQKVSGDTFRALKGLIRFRLDHILARDSKLLKAGKLRSGKLSDHDIIWSDFLW
jgi:endonuclease/exonuclease/phosphatase family metal-dependent hydrolase